MAVETENLPAKEANGASSVPKSSNDGYSVQVKPEFVLNARDASLPPLPLPAESDAAPAADESKKKKRGMNRKRPRDARIEAGSKLCLKFMRGETCPFGDTCRFSHDIKGFLAERPADIQQVIDNYGCPNYDLYGYCPFGPMCRVGSCHMNLATGESLTKQVENAPKAEDVTVNTLSRDVQELLRKRRYPFKCKRFDEKKKEPDAAKTEPAVNMEPLPTKERKLIDFSNKVYVAPLTTVGNLPFRRIMKGFGADITCGEMALASNLLDGKPSEWALLKRHKSEDVFGVQIAAGYPDMFTRTCELLESQTTVDFVDLNLGCPLEMVCHKGAGATLMTRENRLKASLMGITGVLSCPITIKMRTGWDMDSPIAHKLVPKVHEWGLPSGSVAAIMMHGRSRLQRYSKEADWDYIAQVAAANRAASDGGVPLIGNGDIFSYTDYEIKVLANEDVLPCAMLARGALIKPWLPTEIKERRHWDISATERLDMLKDFVRFGLEHWGSDQQGVNNCRRFLLEWLSFLHRYIPVGMLEVVPQHMNHRPPSFMRGRSDLETLLLSENSSDWIKISEMLLGPVPDGFKFEPKHKAKSYQSEG